MWRIVYLKDTGMKVRIAPEVFAAAVAKGTRNVPARPVAPIRAGVSLSTTDDALSIASFDDEVSTVVRLPAAVAEPGAVVVSGRLLAEMVKYLPAAAVELTHDSGQLRIDCGSAGFALPVLPVEDYPALPESPAAAGSVAVADFTRAIGQTAMATSKDDTVPVLTGIQLELRAGTMTLSSTDRYRMALSQVPWDGPEVAQRILLPGKTLSSLAKMLDGERVAVGTANGTVGFVSDGMCLVSRTMDGSLPDPRNHLIFESHGEVRVDTAALLDSVRRVAFAAPRGGAVLLRVADERVAVMCGEDQAARASDTVPCRHSGSGLRIAFNQSYLQECLAAMPTGIAVLSVAGDNSRALFTPDNDDSYRHLIMPIRQRV